MCSSDDVHVTIHYDDPTSHIASVKSPIFFLTDGIKASFFARETRLYQNQELGGQAQLTKAKPNVLRDHVEHRHHCVKLSSLCRRFIHRP